MGQKVLSEKHKLLVERYLDGECKFFSRWRAEKLLDRNPLAAQYFEELSDHAETHRAYDREVSGPPADFATNLWTIVDRRIEQEERAAFLLGERRASSRSSALRGFLARTNPFSQMSSLGLATAASCAVAAIGVAATGTIGDFSADDEVRDRSVRTASVAVDEAESAPQEVLPIASEVAPRVQVASSGGSYLNPRFPSSSVEVDWMRSSGRVQVLHSGGNGDPVIFIRPRTRVYQEPLRQVSRAPMVASSPVPIARFASE